MISPVVIQKEVELKTVFSGSESFRLILELLSKADFETAQKDQTETSKVNGQAQESSKSGKKQKEKANKIVDVKAKAMEVLFFVKQDKVSENLHPDNRIGSDQDIDTHCGETKGAKEHEKITVRACKSKLSSKNTDSEQEKRAYGQDKLDSKPESESRSDVFDAKEVTFHRAYTVEANEDGNRIVHFESGLLSKDGFKEQAKSDKGKTIRLDAQGWKVKGTGQERKGLDSVRRGAAEELSYMAKTYEGRKDTGAEIELMDKGYKADSDQEKRTYGLNKAEPRLHTEVKEGLKVTLPKSESKLDVVFDTKEVISHKSELVNKLADVIYYTAANKKEELVVQLKPELLGKLKIKLTSESGHLKIELFTENSALRDTIASHVSMLQRFLTDRGIFVQEIGVFLGWQGFQEGRRFSAQKIKSYPWRVIGLEEEVMTSSSHRRVWKMGDEGELDYWA